jgi:hypothetical protein
VCRRVAVHNFFEISEKTCLHFGVLCCLCLQVLFLGFEYGGLTFIRKARKLLPEWLPHMPKDHPLHIHRWNNLSSNKVRAALLVGAHCYEEQQEA